MLQTACKTQHNLFLGGGGAGVCYFSPLFSSHKTREEIFHIYPVTIHFAFGCFYGCIYVFYSMCKQNIIHSHTSGSSFNYTK